MSVSPLATGRSSFLRALCGCQPRFPLSVHLPGVRFRPEGTKACSRAIQRPGPVAPAAFRPEGAASAEVAPFRAGTVYLLPWPVVETTGYTPPSLRGAQRPDQSVFATTFSPTLPSPLRQITFVNSRPAISSLSKPWPIRRHLSKSSWASAAGESDDVPGLFPEGQTVGFEDVRSGLLASEREVAHPQLRIAGSPEVTHNASDVKLQ